MNEATLRPEDFLAMLRRSKRGRLKLYIGFAAGVGKTYRMLEEAHALARRGVDVALGFVETHGRADTAALVAGLEQVARRRIEYRGVTIEEMDVDAIVARHPEIVVVDEIAHTNAPGSRNRRRYQDVLEILEAGISVIGAFNIQHLESLNDVVERATLVKTRETVPDGFLREADQIVNLDLAVEDLLERLKGGKIYSTDKIPWALENFFTSEKLATLRELALREVAESLDRGGGPGRRARARGPAANGEPAGASVAAKGPELGRVMVCMSSYPRRAAALLRRGSRLAGKLNTDWFVVYVETPEEAPHLIDAESQRHLLANIERARELGAEVVRLKGHDAVAALLDFARSHGVGQIVLGRSRDAWWRERMGRTAVARMLREGAEFDVFVAAREEKDDAR
ncbi:MAG TPA: histidine kinase [Polyangia bacterium]|jgi:two-component system sensor histidine kinase KdpD|nr:histidine kinase [Polyangia bacterium]